MNYLIDTHAFIWFLDGNNKLSINARNAIEHKDSVNFISIVSLWEMSIKISLGKLQLKMPFSSISSLIEENGFQILPITFDDTVRLSTLPFHHADPFDRLIIAQSINNNFELITKDPIFSNYQIPLIW